MKNMWSDDRSVTLEQKVKALLIRGVTKKKLDYVYYTLGSMPIGKPLVHNAKQLLSYIVLNIFVVNILLCQYNLAVLNGSFLLTHNQLVVSVKSSLFVVQVKCKRVCM